MGCHWCFCSPMWTWGICSKVRSWRCWKIFWGARQLVVHYHMFVIPNPLCVFFGVHLYEFSLVTTCKSLKLGGGGFKLCCCLFSSRTSREIRSNFNMRTYFSGGQKKTQKKNTYVPYAVAVANIFFFVRYALLFSFPGNEGVTLQLQSPQLTTVEALIMIYAIKGIGRNPWECFPWEYSSHWIRGYIQGFLLDSIEIYLDRWYDGRETSEIQEFCNVQGQEDMPDRRLNTRKMRQQRTGHRGWGKGFGRECGWHTRNQGFDPKITSC